MSIADIGNYDEFKPAFTSAPGKPTYAGKPTVFAPRRGKFIPPSRVSEQRRQAVGVGARDCFYHGAPPLQAKSQYQKEAHKGETVVVPNTEKDGAGFATVYQKDFGKSVDRPQFIKANSADAAFGKVPMGGFIKFHDVENRAQTGNIPDEQYNMIYSQAHFLGQVADMSTIGAMPKAERPKRAAVDYDSLKLLSKARERMNMRTLNFSELPGQDLNPKPMRKGHEEYGERHKASQITWAYHG